jgi:mannosyltransferase
MLWGIGARPYWGDEADTVSAVSRSLPQLIRLLKHIDAVHGLYYLLLWPVVRVAGTGELVTRLPSAVAMAAAAAGVTAIARRLASRQAGLCAGLIFAALPTVSLQGHDARPYAMVTAAAVLASYLLVRAAENPRPRWFTGYGLSLALVGYLQLFGLLLVPAHAVALIGLGRRRRAAGDGQPRGAPRAPLARGWLVTIAAVAVAVAPVTILGWAQRAQIAWIPRPGWHDVGDLAATLAADSAAAAVVIGLLSVLGGTRAGSLAPVAPRAPARARPGGPPGPGPHLAGRALAGAAARHAPGGVRDHARLLQPVRDLLPARGGAAGRRRARRAALAGAGSRPGPGRGARRAGAGGHAGARGRSAGGGPVPQRP